MPGIRKELIVHDLYIDPSIRLIVEKRSPVGEEKLLTIRQE